MSDFDFDAIAAEFDATFQEEPIEETPETEEVETEAEVEPEAETQDNEPSEEIDAPSEQEAPPVADDKRNAAFADLRRQAQEAKKYQDFINRLAEESGVTPEEILARYEERQMEAEAERQNVPVDVIKRLSSLEQENQAIKQQTFEERFNSQVDSAVAKYNASDDDVEQAFKYAAENGIDLREGKVNFDAVYRMAHLDTIVQREIENARQSDLSAKKKRQQEAAIPNGNSVTQSGTSDLEEQAAADAKKILENW